MQNQKDYAIKISINMFVLCAIGFATRWFQSMNIFDVDTGLATAGATSSYVLIAYSAFALIRMFFVLRPFQMYSGGKNPEELLGCGDGIYKVLANAAAIAFIAGGVLLMLNAKNYLELSQLVFILGALAVASGGCTMYLSSEETRGGISWVFATVPIAFLCIWLILSYKQHASSAIVWQYAIEIIGLALSAEAFFLIAGLAYEKARIFPTVLMSCSATFFMFMSLADSRAIEFQVCVVAVALYSFSTVYGMVMNVEDKHRRRTHRQS